MKHTHDIAIVGGGMVGMCLALTLAKAGIKVAVIEKTGMPEQLDPAFDGRVSAIALGSKHILDNAGAWQFMAPYAEPILDIRVTDGHTPIFLHYDHKEVGDEPFGYIIENRYTRYGTQQAAKLLSTLEIFDHSSVAKFSAGEGGVTVCLEGKHDIRCALLIGADGRQSQIRDMAGIKTTGWSYHETAIVCTIEHEKPHHGLAQERFLPAGAFAVLPMQNNCSSLVWVEPEDRVALYMALEEKEFVQEITERVGDYLGEIKTKGKRFSYPLSLLHAQSYTGKRLALMGDAAHGMHPIAGQGVNLGFRDVGVLAELIIKDYAMGLDIGNDALLAHYERWRAFDNVAMLAGTDALNRLFKNNIIPIKLARDAGLWAVGKIPPLKRFFMRHAMGLVGDLPEAVRKAGNT